MGVCGFRADPFVLDNQLWNSSLGDTNSHSVVTSCLGFLVCVWETLRYATFSDNMSIDSAVVQILFI